MILFDQPLLIKIDRGSKNENLKINIKKCIFRIMSQHEDIFDWFYPKKTSLNNNNNNQRKGKKRNKHNNE